VHFQNAGIDLCVAVNRDGANLNALALAILDALGLP